MLFAKIATLLKNPADTLILSVAPAEDGCLRVTVTPHTPPAKDGKPEAAGERLIDRPIVVTATPEELDAGLPSHIVRSVATVRGFEAASKQLNETLEKERKETEKLIAEQRNKRSTTVYPKAAVPAPEPALF